MADFFGGRAPYVAPGSGLADEAGEGFELEGAEADYIAPEVFQEQWAALHDMASGMVQMRTGRACALGDQARSAGGQMAGQAVYSLLSSTPVLARMFLSPQPTFIGQLFAIGKHSFACVQMVKASTDPASQPEAAA